VAWFYEIRGSNNTLLSGAQEARTRNFLPLVALVPVLGLYWFISGIVLWWAYGIAHDVARGYYQHHQALVLVAEMGLLLTVLTSVVWLFRLRRRAKIPRWRIGWRAAWQTALVLIAYLAIVIAHLEFLGRIERDSDFSPLPAHFMGQVHADFFSEMKGPLTFFFYVVPVMACVSGVLCYLYFLAIETLRNLKTV
jgi:hypothetical protein